MRFTAAALAAMATSLVAAQYDIAEDSGIESTSQFDTRDMVKLTVYERSETDEPVTLWVHKSFKIRSDEDAAADFPQLAVRDDKKNATAKADDKKKKTPKKKTFKVHVTEFNDSIVKWVPASKPKKDAKKNKDDKKKDDKAPKKKENETKEEREKREKEEKERKEKEKEHKEKENKDKENKNKDKSKPKTDEERKKAREQAKQKAKEKFERGSCGGSTFVNKTTIAAPFTGGCLAIRNWAKKNPGKWVFSPAKVQGEINLIVAGSNSGANCRFALVNSSGHKTYVANIDVQQLVDDSHRRFRVRYGKSSDPAKGHRMAAEGEMKCDKQFKNGTNFEQKVKWAILKFDGQV